jgi:hypothetical protein
MTTTCEFILVNAGRDGLVEAAASMTEAMGTVSALIGIRTPSPSIAVPGATGERVGEGGVEDIFPRFLGDEDGGVEGLWFCCGGVEGFWD